MLYAIRRTSWKYCISKKNPKTELSQAIVDDYTLCPIKKIACISLYKLKRVLTSSMAERKQSWQCSSELEELDLARSVLLRPNLPTHWCIFWTETDIHNFLNNHILPPCSYYYKTFAMTMNNWTASIVNMEGIVDYPCLMVSATPALILGYCITQVRIIVSVCSNPLPPFLWTLLKRSQTLTLYFDRAKGRFYYLSRGWQVVTRLAHRPVEKVYGPLYRNVSACTWPCS